MDEKTPSIGEKILKYIPFASVGLLVLGYLYNGVYYYSFGINVLNYTSAEDIIYPLFPLLIIISVLIAILIIISYRNFDFENEAGNIFFL